MEYLGEALDDMSSPPVPPAQAPSMLSGLAPAAAEGDDESASSALPKLFYEMDKTLELIASVVPKGSRKIAEIKQRLDDLMAIALRSGAERSDEDDSL